ncbi:uroporphyrinogen-III C-methyltransferase [uncultured Jatrophihabitans sp.]|uniref:uroporphyrinogen-III C-methyltransferase n=1 Tax=uncultured Jatrophihabitans sp. TaxID=1610747 RepID=UPI0035CA9BD2
MLLDVTGRRVVVVGAGRVATRRVRGLVDAHADIVVIAPEVDDAVRLAGVTVHERPFAARDLDGAWLAVACTDDPGVNAAVSDAAAARRVFCVRADNAGEGSARTPAVARHGDVTIAVNGGDDPARTRALRDAISAALAAGDLPLRAHRRPAAGSVALVGGGPGDPELITVLGQRLVSDADVVVVDRLAPRQLLDALPDSVEVIDCGKSAHRHNLTQSEINDVLVDRALAGKRVVRLKGGDPFVFGRGGEEWLACLAAGVPVTVVPGISSALAAPALAGIPLTHRGLAADFTVVSGHLDPGRPADQGVDWPGLAVNAGTLVILMAMDRLHLIADALIEHGRPASTPAAVVHRAASEHQQVVRARLDGIAAAAREAGLSAPAVVVVGAVVDVLA